MILSVSSESIKEFKLYFLSKKDTKTFDKVMICLTML